MITQLKKWLHKYKKYFFRYRNGFYELPYFANSPHTVNAGCTGVPFIKHDKTNNRFIINNLFVKATTTYYEIEEGLWIYFLDIEHKKNIKLKPIFDEGIKNNYYLFSLTQMRDNFHIKVRAEKKECYLDKVFWTLFKPLSNPDYMNNKNSCGHCITVYFSEAWLTKNILNKPEWQDGKAVDFFKSQKKLISWPEVSGITPETTFDFTAMLLENKNELDDKKIKRYAHNSVTHFFNALNKATNCNYFDLNNQDREKLFKIEKYLLDNLAADFVGIDFLAEQFVISPTKLKNDFKTQYDKSLFQYFREKQMQLAEQLLKKQNHSIKDVAAILGYQSASKFSVAFKEHIGVLPSEV